MACVFEADQPSLFALPSRFLFRSVSVTPLSAALACLFAASLPLRPTLPTQITLSPLQFTQIKFNTTNQRTNLLQLRPLCASVPALSICTLPLLLQQTHIPLHLKQTPLKSQMTRSSMTRMPLTVPPKTRRMRKSPNQTRRQEDERLRSNLFRTNRDVI